MQDKLITLSHPSTGLEELIQKANDLIRAAQAPSTRKAYQSDFRIFECWCAAHGLASLPSAPETIALYIASCVVARLAPATIARVWHRSRKPTRLLASKTLPPPLSISLSAKSSKALAAPWASHRMQRPTSVERHLPPSCGVPEESPRPRDRALILIGFAGAFRRSELCAMTVLICAFQHPARDQRAALESRSGAGRRKSCDPVWRTRGYLPDQSASRMARRG